MSTLSTISLPIAIGEERTSLSQSRNEPTTTPNGSTGEIDKSSRLDLPNTKRPHSHRGNSEAFELHPIPAYLTSERQRRPSALARPASLAEFQNAKDAPVFANDIDDLEMHHQHTSVTIIPVSSAAASIVRVPRSAEEIRRQKRQSLIHFLALCWCIFLEGWNDGSTGPLLPVIQRDYHVGFTIVALLFVANCIGFVTGAVLNVWMNDRFGFGKTILLGAVIQLVAYAILSPGPPFPVMVCAYGIAGLGMSLQNAQANGFVASLKEHMSTKLSMMHAAYGLGACTSPFIATQFSTSAHWSFHFLVAACIAVSNIAVLGLVFKGRRQEEILAEGGQEPAPDSGTRLPDNLYRQIFGLRAVHLMAVFALIYVGVEVTLGGWIVTFIIQERDGGPSAGYISSGFFGGLTLGRVGLMWLNKLVGERRVIYIYSVLAIGLEITIWLVPSIIGNAVAISFIGVFLGPMFPILVSHATGVLPKWLLTGSVGFITGIGVSGSAMLPFVTGVLAGKFGIGSLQPLMVSMMCLMLALWACVPKAGRRVD